ncbi:MAG: DUF1349 domain-containing protein [Muribaculaceae bacterium]|nr:DUF1349 domain-containing protein [Muribaculaceae bacterium]
MKLSVVSEDIILRFRKEFTTVYWRIRIFFVTDTLYLATFSHLNDRQTLSNNNYNEQETSCIDFSACRTLCTRAEFAACPDGEGFNASFSDFSVRHLPDIIRTEWLRNNAE